MGHLSDEFLKSNIKIIPNNSYNKVLAHLMYLTEELPIVKEKGIIADNTGELSVLNGAEIETNLQYVSKIELCNMFGDIDFKEFGDSKVSYSIKGEQSSEHHILKVFSSFSIGEHEFGFKLNMSSIREMLKDFEFYLVRGRFFN